MALVDPTKNVIKHEVAMYDKGKKKWESFGGRQVCYIKKPVPCGLKLDANGDPVGKPDNTWQYTMDAISVKENKSLKNKILSEIKKILNEAPLPTGGFQMPDDTTNIGNRIPSEHKAFIKKLWDITRPYDNNNTPFSKFLASFDSALRNGSDTDNLYKNFFGDYPVAKGLQSQKPSNFSYQASTSAGEVHGKGDQGTGTAGVKAANKPKKYFVCKMPAEVEATKNFQKSKGLTPDGKIGPSTFAELVLDPTIKSGGVDFASKGIKLPELIGNKDPKMKETYQRSVCEALAKTGAAWISGAKLDTKNGKEIDPTRKYDPTAAKLKCPSFIKPTGPYTFEEIQQYVPNYLQSSQQGDDSLIFAVANAVSQATKRSASIGCEEVIQFIQGAIKTKGRSVPGLSSVQTQGQENKSNEMDKLNAARAYASNGTSPDKIGDPEVVQVGKKYGVFKESKNWLDKTREKTTSNLFERLVKDSAKK